jgi:hypothetical protein
MRYCFSAQTAAGPVRIFHRSRLLDFHSAVSRRVVRIRFSPHFFGVLLGRAASLVSVLLPHAASFVLQSLTCSEVSLSCSFLCAAWKDSSPCPACTRFISPPSLGLDFGLSVPSVFHRCVLLWSKFRSCYLNQGSASQSPSLSLSLQFC